MSITQTEDDFIPFAEEEVVALEEEDKSWTIFIVDDDPDVHKATHFALLSVRVYGRPIKLINAYSGQEARIVLQERNDIDLLLIDCVMETEEEGLSVARFLKYELKKKIPVVVVRSGQLGPDNELSKNQVLSKYPFIDDFISKATAGGRGNLVDLFEKMLPN